MAPSVSGLARAGTEGLAALEEFVAVLGKSSAVLEALGLWSSWAVCFVGRVDAETRRQSALGRS